MPKTGDPLAVVQSLPYNHRWFDHGPFLWPNLSTALGGAMVWRHQFHHGIRQGRIAAVGIQERLRAVTVPASLYSCWFERGNPANAERFQRTLSGRSRDPSGTGPGERDSRTAH